MTDRDAYSALIGLLVFDIRVNHDCVYCRVTLEAYEVLIDLLLFDTRASTVAFDCKVTLDHRDNN